MDVGHVIKNNISFLKEKVFLHYMNIIYYFLITICIISKKKYFKKFFIYI